jgi:hypothetical protein
MVDPIGQALLFGLFALVSVARAGTPTCEAGRRSRGFR